jgi:hypothetical protein
MLDQEFKTGAGSLLGSLDRKESGDISRDLIRLFLVVGRKVMALIHRAGMS